VTHAARHEKGTLKADERREEKETIEQMNDIREWYNKGEPKDPAPPRDPNSHDEKDEGHSRPP
jgi:hypothetical protein